MIAYVCKSPSGTYATDDLGNPLMFNYATDAFRFGYDHPDYEIVEAKITFTEIRSLGTFDMT